MQSPNGRAHGAWLTGPGPPLPGRGQGRAPGLISWVCGPLFLGSASLLESTIPHGASAHGPARGDQGLTPRTAGSAPQCFTARLRRRLGVDAVSSHGSARAPAGSRKSRLRGGPFASASRAPGCLPICLSTHHSTGPGGLPTQQPRGLQMGSQPDSAPAPGQATQGVPFGPWGRGSRPGHGGPASPSPPAASCAVTTPRC